MARAVGVGGGWVTRGSDYAWVAPTLRRVDATHQCPIPPQTGQLLDVTTASVTVYCLGFGNCFGFSSSAIFRVPSNFLSVIVLAVWTASANG